MDFQFLTLLLLCVAQTTTVHGIRCFQCNSANNSDCFTLEGYGKYKKFIEPTECPMEFDKAPPFCRKTVLKVLNKAKHDEERVIRSCGWFPHTKECYNTDNEGHQQKVCQCFHDGCNSTDGLWAPRLISLLLVTGSVLYLSLPVVLRF